MKKVLPVQVTNPAISVTNKKSLFYEPQRRRLLQQPQDTASDAELTQTNIHIKNTSKPKFRLQLSKTNTASTSTLLLNSY